MAESIHVTTVVENSVYRGGLGAEHGLAFYLGLGGGSSLLFDTGQTDLVVRNAGGLGVALDRLDAIVLSHGHYDHTGGLAAVRKLAPAARLFLHPQAMSAKYVQEPTGRARAIGMPPASRQAVLEAEGKAVWTSDPTEVLPGIFVTGQVPRPNRFEEGGGRFFADAACTRADSVPDDQALFFDTPEGVVVILGCAHSGVLNTLEYVRHLTPGRPLRAVLGGMHLLNADGARLEKTLQALRAWPVGLVAPAHCTGQVPEARLWGEFGSSYRPCAVGTDFEF